MRIVILEGTVEEVSQVLKLIPELSPSKVFTEREETQAETPLPEKDQVDTNKSVSIEFAALVLTRRPALSNRLKKALTALARQHPGWLSATELQQVTNYQPAQLNGMLGAFGRRISRTDGHETGAQFYEYQWNEELDCWMYRLQENALEALEQVGLI